MLLPRFLRSQGHPFRLMENRQEQNLRNMRTSLKPSVASYSVAAPMHGMVVQS